MMRRKVAEVNGEEWGKADNKDSSRDAFWGAESSRSGGELSFYGWREQDVDGSLDAEARIIATHFKADGWDYVRFRISGLSQRVLRPSLVSRSSAHCYYSSIAAEGQASSHYHYYYNYCHQGDG